jgi:transposase-like protein
MKPYSKDLRLKVLDAVERGIDRKEVARVFGVSLPSIKRWLKRRTETGGVEASTIPGPPAVKGDMMLAEWLPSQLERNPELTLQESIARLLRRITRCEGFQRATRCAAESLSWREGGRSKKVSRSPRRARGAQARAVQVARGAELRRQEACLCGRESGFTISMMRLRARAPKGKRAYGTIPRNLKARTKPSSPR